MTKDKYWQFIRGTSIILIILIHTLYVTNIGSINYTNIIIRRIINCATAIFIFIAGYFSHGDDTKGFYRKKIKRIIIPLIIWDIIYCVFSVDYSHIDIKDILVRLVLSKTAGHLYFLYVLIQLFLLYPLLKKIIRSKFKYFPLVITPIYCALVVIYRIKFGSVFPLYNYWFLGWISYYYLGLLFQNAPSVKIPSKLWRVLFVVIPLAFTLFEGVKIYNLFGIYDLAVSQLTLGNSIYSLFIAYIIYANRNVVMKDNLLVRFGDYSFGIYFSHLLIIKILKKGFEFLNNDLNYWIVVSGIFALTLIIVYTLNRIYYEKVKVKL